MNDQNTDPEILVYGRNHLHASCPRSMAAAGESVDNRGKRKDKLTTKKIYIYIYICVGGLTHILKFLNRFKRDIL